MPHGIRKKLSELITETGKWVHDEREVGESALISPDVRSDWLEAGEDGPIGA